MKGAKEILLGALFLFALAGGITLLLRQSPPKAIELILPTPTSTPASQTVEQGGAKLVNVNTATLGELDTLYGIGQPCT